MKTLIRMLFIIITITGLAVPAFSVEMLIGARVWYASWNPFLKDVGEKVAKTEGWQYIDTGSGMLYGPSVSVILNKRWSFSISYLYGVLEAPYSADYKEHEGSGYNEYHYYGNVKTERHDLDSVLSFNIGGSLKLFAGFKYQPLELKATKRGSVYYLNADGSRTGGGLYIDKSEVIFKQKNYAPGIGVGFSHIFGNIVAVTANLSAIYLFGDVEIDFDDTEYYSQGATWEAPMISKMSDFKTDISGFGVNIDPGVVIFIGESILLNVGFRFQYVRMKMESTGEIDEISGMNDYLYGAYISLLYKL